MSKRIRVHIVHYKDCKNIVMRYIDPVTGKPARSSSPPPTTYVGASATAGPGECPRRSCKS
jgi:hypothetical protein